MVSKVISKIELKLKKTICNEKTETKPIAFFIEGGGTKGVYALGILRYLFEENPYLDITKVNIFGGTSVGSFFATCLSLGYTKDDIMEISRCLDIENLIDSKYMFMFTLYRFMSKGYMYNDDGRLNIIKKILDLKFSSIKKDLELDSVNTVEDITFGHLRKLIEKKPLVYKHLIINTVDISRHEQIFMTTLTSQWDNIKLVDAMMASSAIPFAFRSPQFFYDPNSKTYDYKANNSEAMVCNMVDGGVSTNNPLDYFLINENIYRDYNLWLLKFTADPDYTKIDSNLNFLWQLAEYLISGKNDIKMDLIERDYKINCINLHCTAKTLQIYTPEQIKNIIDEVYANASNFLE